MGRQKNRDLIKKQRRQIKLRALKQKLAETTAPKERAKIIEKLRKISLYPDREVPKA